MIVFQKVSGFDIQDVKNAHLRVQENYKKFMKKLKSAVLSDRMTKAYSVKAVVLNSLHFGLAQSRKRLYIVGIKNVKGKVMKPPNLQKKQQPSASQNSWTNVVIIPKLMWLGLLSCLFNLLCFIFLNYKSKYFQTDLHH